LYECHVPTGDDDLAIEQTILRRRPAAGHGIHLTAAQLPNGWSETFDARRVTAQSLQDAIHREAAALERGLCREPLTLF
jgi:hypothetical protein